MKRALKALICCCAFACAAPKAAVAPPRILPDSIVLERTPCFGMCPAYRLSLSKAGRVAFTSKAAEATDSLAPGVFSDLYRGFEKLGFASLPGEIMQVKEFCDPVASDMSSAVLTVFTGEKKKSVKDYHGCFASTDSMKQILRGLRRLEDSVDSAAHAGRWIRPSVTR